jgi:hypothetical protein
MKFKVIMEFEIDSKHYVNSPSTTEEAVDLVNDMCYGEADWPWGISEGDTHEEREPTITVKESNG